MIWKKYCKIPKISPRAYIFQVPFWGAYIRRGLSMERNLRFKIDWANLIVRRNFTVFALFYFLCEGNFQVRAPGGLIFGGAYFRNFTVCRWKKSDAGNRNLMSRIAAVSFVRNLFAQNPSPPPPPFHWRADFCPMTTPKLASNHWTYVCWEISH